jgi:diphthamide biosynthesis protein 2
MFTVQIIETGDFFLIYVLISRRLPVLHIYTDLPINIQNLAEQVKQKFGTDSTNLAIFYDVRYHRAFSQTKNIFENLQPNFNISICEPSAEAGQAVQCGRICPENLDENWVTLYVGQNENYSLLLGLTFSQVFGHFVFNPQSECPKIEQSSVNVKKALMKRYYLIERARDAARIGIIVGTLGVTRYQNVIDYVKDVVKKSGKKSYTFLVGKPNVPKLANFSEVKCLKIHTVII